MVPTDTAPPLVVRLLTPDDIDLVLDATDVFDDDVVPHQAVAFLAHPDHWLAGAVDGERLVGFASGVRYLHPDKPTPELWVNELGVAESHRRRGLGRRLVTCLLDAGRSAGCAIAWVLTEDDNDPALALYRRLPGAVETTGVVMFEVPLDDSDAAERD